MQTDPQLGFVPAAILDAEQAHAAPTEVERWYKESNLNDKSKNARIGLIVISPEAKVRLARTEKDSAALSRELYQTVLRQVQVIDLPTFSEQILRRVPIAALSELWFLEHVNEAGKKLYEAGKTFFDLALAATLALVFLATFPFVFVSILLAQGWPIFYTQERVGKNGRRFKIIKYRTMIRGAETNGPQFAAESDPRVTPIGKLLRKTRLDELPQVLNVLKSDMSFVGPRPERPELVEQITEEIPFYNARHLVKPGLTGWAQINFSYAASIEENIKKLQYDLYYIKHRSFALDAAIILKTIPIILSSKGQ